MTRARELETSELRWSCGESLIGGQSSDDLEDLHEILGQRRALDAVQFGIGIRSDGYNMFVLGPPGLGKRSTLQRFLGEKSATQDRPDDWCYLHNFESPHKPVALRLPAGRGLHLKRSMAALVEELRTAIPAALKIEEHNTRIQEVERAAKERHESAFRELSDRAVARGLQLVQTPQGYAMAPMRDGEAIGSQEFEKLDPAERDKIERAVAEFQEELKALVEQVPERRKEMRQKIDEINRQATRAATCAPFRELRSEYHEMSAVCDYLTAVEQDVIESADEFLPHDERSEAMSTMGLPQQSGLTRYEVNLLVDNSTTDGGPVVFENHPSYQNLLGRVEHESRMGTLVTQFNLIKPGALHRANGGYLVIDALKLLQQPFAWEGVKRALNTKQMSIESLGEATGTISTVTLEPEPIPLDVKVILVGDRMLYYTLYQQDRDVAELFKVAADFDEQMERTDESCRLYARYLATMVRQEGLRPFETPALANVIEHSVRLAGDAEKLSTSMQTIVSLLREADYWASNDEATTVTARHVTLAIEKQVYRSNRVQMQVYERIRRGTVLIDTSGRQVGQVNGLSVIDMGNYAFGQPSRITATTRIGKGDVIDIEREVELGGALHSKGVLILSSFLATRFAKSKPLALAASLVFEQSYGLVDGDSASAAELCALMSSLADVPIDQGLAITGSVNQRGCVQAIGGVNEKIEGFFDVCSSLGLNGRQGVLIPSANVKHLMLRDDVVAAVASNQFRVCAVESIDQALQLLTGLEAGAPDENGQYPDDSVNGRVARRLDELFALRQAMTGGADEPEKP